MTRFLRTISLVLLHVALSNSFKGSLVSSSKHIKRGKLIGTRLYVVEHLVDCVANPAMAELYGGLSSDYCLQRAGEESSSLFRGLGGLIEQAATIGFLVMSYFFFKRSANGISELEDDDDDDEVDYRGGSNSDFDNELRRCPQCNGRGKFEFDGNSGSAPLCDLCGGSGTIMRTVRAKTLGLPMSSRQLWSESDSDQNADNGDDNNDDDDATIR